MTVMSFADYDARALALPYCQWVTFYNLTGRGCSDEEAFQDACAVKSLDDLHNLLNVSECKLPEVMSA